MKTPKKIGKAIAKRVKSWRGSPNITTAKGAAIEESKTFDVPKNVEVKEQKRNHHDS